MVKCGIERLGFDHMFSVKVSVLPGKLLHESHWIFTGLRLSLKRTFIPECLHTDLHLLFQGELKPGVIIAVHICR